MRTLIKTALLGWSSLRRYPRSAESFRMVVLSCRLIAFVLSLAIVNCDGQCDEGYWGDNCMNYCGHCSTEWPDTEEVANTSESTVNPFHRNCSYVDGRCDTDCEDGWSGDRCDEPICRGGCGTGECLAPNYCGKCGSISKISPNCEDIRLRGLVGALISILVIAVWLMLIKAGSHKPDIKDMYLQGDSAK